MIRQISFFAIILILSALVAACSAPAVPAAPTAQVAATSGPAATSTVVPVPPQPTSATLAPRTSVPFVSPTPAAIVPGGTPLASFAPALTGPGSAPVGPAGAAPTNAPATVAPVAAAPTNAGPVPTAPGVATGKRSEVKFVFLTPLLPAEEAEPADLVSMRAELKKLAGFIEISDIDDGKGATVGYDAGLITVEQLMVKFADLKHPVKKQ